jgi:MYXO-CTERM domain-containing protein
MVGGAAAAALAGEIHDLAGEYTLAIYLSGFLGLIAAGLAFGVRRRAQTPEPPLTAAAM